jgi:IS4 transposase
MPPKYQLVVNDIDHLVAKIFDVCDLNPIFFTRGLNDYARDAITRINPLAEFFLPKAK